MKIAISGSSGFIGTHLSSVLSFKGFEIVKITQELLYSPNDLTIFFDTEQPDYIFHLAAYGNQATQKEEAMMVFSNIIGTYNMLSASRAVLYKAFINFGSSSEYGKKDYPMSEKDILLPETFYGASKAAATHLAYAFAKQYEKPIITVRPFSVYGPHDGEHRFIQTVIRSILTKKVFPLDEKAVHDWIYIDDFIDGIMVVMNNPQKIPQHIINIGSGKMNTNKEVCELLKRITGQQYLARPQNKMRKNDSSIWLADNSLISNLGWYPKHMLSEGLEKTYKYYLKNDN